MDQTTDPPPDPVGMALAAAVLASMLFALGYAVWRIAGPQTRQHISETAVNTGGEK